MKKAVQTVLAIASAILLTGLGVALFVHANLGSDTITVFIDGLHRILNVSYGTASRIYNAIMLIIALIVSFKNIGWATIIYALTVGFAMDFFEVLLAPLNIVNMNQVDAIAYAIVNKTNIPFKWIRTGADVVLLVIGWLLGGVIGIGSVIAMSTTGILIDFFLKILGTETDKTS